MILTYVGVPAPEVLQDDPWFGPAPLTERSVFLAEARKQAELDNQILSDDDEPHPKEPENIHEIIYQIATKNVCTTLSLDPIPTFIGGSENHQGTWMSGSGFY